MRCEQKIRAQFPSERGDQKRSRHSAMHCSEAEAHWVRRLKAHSPGCAAGASVVVAKAHKVGAARSSDGPRWTGTGIGAAGAPDPQ